MARIFVEEKLAACVNIVPGVRSIYRWEGAICDDAEVLMIVKTRASRLEQLKTRLAQVHPYDTPEMLVLDVVDGAEKYLKWLADAVR